MNRAKLQELMVDHEPLKDAFLHDATVHAWLRQFELDRCTLEEAFIGIIVHLTKEKKHYFDEVVGLSSMVAKPKTFYIQKDKREKFNQGDSVVVTETEE